MRETELWARLEHHLGAGYAHVWVDQINLAALSNRTVREALAGGVPCKTIWRAVHEHLELPARER